VGKLAVVLRVEGNELVVVAAAGRGLLPATRLIFKFARDNGLSTIRFHTRRKRVTPPRKTMAVSLNRAARE
jgi:hypothetical protein